MTDRQCNRDGRGAYQGSAARVVGSVVVAFLVAAATGCSGQAGPPLDTRPPSGKLVPPIEQSRRSTANSPSTAIQIRRK